MQGPVPPKLLLLPRQWSTNPSTSCVSAVKFHPTHSPHSPYSPTTLVLACHPSKQRCCRGVGVRRERLVQTTSLLQRDWAVWSLFLPRDFFRTIHFLRCIEQIYFIAYWWYPFCESQGVLSPWSISRRQRGRGGKSFSTKLPTPPLLVCHIWPGPASFVRKHSRAFIKSFPLLWPSKTFGNFVERRDQFWGCLTTHWWIMGSTKAEPLHRLWPCHIFCYHCKLPRGAAIFTPNPHGISDYRWCQRCTDSSRTVHTTTRDFPLFPSATAQISFSIIPYWIFMYKISLFDLDLPIITRSTSNIPCRKRQTVMWNYTSYVSDGPG